MTPMLLTYALPQEKLARLRFACLRLGIQVLAVDAADYAQPLGALCGLTPRVEDAPAPEGDIPEELLVMANFTTTLANRFLAALKQAKLIIRLKAVVTPTNAQWDSVTLYRELIREREAIASGAPSEHRT